MLSLCRARVWLAALTLGLADPRARALDHPRTWTWSDNNYLRDHRKLHDDYS